MFSFLKKTGNTSKQFSKYISKTFGIKPRQIALYQQAFVHKSILREEKNSHFKSNERLEFLGDAVLDNVVAEYLYDNFPNKDEGFLTQLKSRLVNGSQLNEIGLKLGFEQYTRFQQFGTSAPKALYGDVLEALIGAMYIDLGFSKTKKSILKKILIPNIDLEKIATNDNDYKSQLIIWAQRKRKQLKFKLLNERLKNNQKIFEMAVVIDDKEISKGEADSKREAEKIASGKALKKLGIQSV